VITKEGKFAYTHARTLIDKVKSTKLGQDLSKWSAEDIKKLGPIIKDLDLEDLRKLLVKQFQVINGAMGWTVKMAGSRHAIFFVIPFFLPKIVFLIPISVQF